MRVSSRAIIFKDNKVLFMYRERNNEKYYAFPGGKIEDGETKEDCIKRECKEELGITISVEKHVYEVKGDGFIQHFYLCKWIDGKLGSGDEVEYSANRKGGIQKPCFIEIAKLNDLNVISPFIVNQLLEDIEKYGLNLDFKVKQIIEK